MQNKQDVDQNAAPSAEEVGAALEAAGYPFEIHLYDRLRQGGMDPVFAQGMYQVTLDSVTTDNPYGLDSSGNIWAWTTSEFSAGWVALPTVECPTSPTIHFAQIAAKNGVVFGLSTTGSGTVWTYTNGGPNACWTQVGTRSAFVSVATVNDLTTDVWASDISGNMWTSP